MRLRPLTDADMEPYLAMAADPEVTRYVSPTPIPRAGAEAAANHYRRQLETKGYGYWAIEVNGGAPPEAASALTLTGPSPNSINGPSLESSTQANGRMEEVASLSLVHI